MAQSRGHGADSHGHHHHHHHNVFLTATNKNDAGVRITRIGLYCNLGMCVAKGLGGYLFNSQAMVADAWHSATDLASDLLTLLTVSWSLKPPTGDFPLGLGKIESLGSLGVSGMLLAGGLAICYGSCESLFAHLVMDPAAVPDLLHQGHGHSHSHAFQLPSLHAAWLAAGTVAIKEWLYHATIKVARDRKSSVLASNAVHHRVDSWTGIVTLIVILAANFVHNTAWLDPVGCLLISLLVIKAGWSNMISALYELADRTIDAEVRESVRKQVTKALQSEADQVELREIVGLKSGQNYLIDLEVATPGDWSVTQLGKMEEAVRVAIGNKVRGVRRVRVRFVPNNTTAAPFDEFIASHVSPRSSPEPEDEHNHHEHDQRPKSD